jgi:TPR repeat protein
MAHRPHHIDIPNDLDPLDRPLFTPSHQNLTPPTTGSIPPALSPLDAFAFQSRLLAKRFEEENSNGKRLSRLPHLTIQNEFAKNRAPFFRAESFDSASPNELSSPEDATPVSVTEVKPGNRPMSTHPMIHSSNDSIAGGFAISRGGPFHNALASVDESRESPVEQPQLVAEQSYFPFPRSDSPTSLDNASLYSNPQYPSESTTSSQHSGPMPSFALPVRPSRQNLAAPSPMVTLGGSPSIRYVMEESNSEDVDNLSLGGSVDSWGMPKTPASPLRAHMARSPSLTSEKSFGSTGLPRPNYNFSRPLSRARNPSFDTKRWVDSPNRQDSGTTGSSRPSLDVPFRQDSADSPLTPLTDLPQTPISVSSNEFFAYDGPASDPSHQPSSYTYAKYSLPRGKAPKRESLGVEEFFNRHSALINWDYSGTERNGAVGPPNDGQYDLPSPALTNSPPKTRRKERPADIAIPRATPRASEETQSSPRARKYHKSEYSSPTTTTSDSSTIKARLARSKELSSEITPEMHLEKGINCHEAGSLQESTYHFRLAAKAGLADAMLLYALACRHGWGMRPSPADAVMWLRKAVDSAQLEVAEDEQTAKAGKHLDTMEKAKHRAQFALGAYELGISYMKGWGVPQDKALALRCFEVAGSWGDADALAEAGFCYAEGVGTKKDMKKAAKFYRAAEAKGMSMAGNSW